MDNYNEYLEERLLGMYTNYNSIVLEEFKKKTDREKINKSKKEFINYLAYKYQDRDIRYEFNTAETEEEKMAVADKYEKDFNEFLKRQRGLKVSLLSAITSIGANVAGASSIASLLCFLAWGIVIKTMVNDIQKMDKAGEEKYLKNRKK